MEVPPKTKVKTRFYIISDTHGRVPKPAAEPGVKSGSLGPSDTDSALVLPLPRADVAMHAGDLTSSSRVDEFAATLRMLRELDAPLKLVIAGNHDWLLDDGYVGRTFRQVAPSPSAASGGGGLGIGRSARDRGVIAQADRVKALIDEARQDGVRYLTEGTYDFVLGNGARLRVYASPSTPQYGSWAFQYAGAHEFAIPAGCDVVLTHGPPRGVLDTARGGQLAGSDTLFEAVYRARPRMHCFGHIHEAWGARLITWRDLGPEEMDIPAAESLRKRAVDEERSATIDTLASVDPDLSCWSPDGGGGGSGSGGVWRFGFGKMDAKKEEEMERERERRAARLKKLYAARGRHFSLCAGEEARAVDEPGRQTLFVNAAVVSTRYRARQLPWIVDLELDAADEGASNAGGQNQDREN